MYVCTYVRMYVNFTACRCFYRPVMIYPWWTTIEIISAEDWLVRCRTYWATTENILRLLWQCLSESSTWYQHHTYILVHKKHIHTCMLHTTCIHTYIYNTYIHTPGRNRVGGRNFWTRSLQNLWTLCSWWKRIHSRMTRTTDCSFILLWSQEPSACSWCGSGLLSVGSNRHGR